MTIRLITTSLFALGFAGAMAVSALYMIYSGVPHSAPQALPNAPAIGALEGVT